MKYWRMQLHPNDAKNAAHYANQSLSAGFIGLDFATEVGDLLWGLKGSDPFNLVNFP